MEIIKVILTSLLSAAVLFLLAKIMGHKNQWLIYRVKIHSFLLRGPFR